MYRKYLCNTFLNECISLGGELLSQKGSPARLKCWLRGKQAGTYIQVVGLARGNIHHP